MKWIKLHLIAFVVLVSANACKTHEEAIKALPKVGDTYELGSVSPEVRTIENDTARIALYPHARWFYLDMTIKGSQDYITLIQTAAKSGRQVKARIFKHPATTSGEEIAEIY